MMGKNEFPMHIEPQVIETREVFIGMNELAIAMRMTDNEDEDGSTLCDLRTEAIERILNEYIKRAETVSVGSLNLFDIERVELDTCDYHDGSDKYCTVGLRFYGPDTDLNNRALLLLDAETDDIVLRPDGKLLSIGIDSHDEKEG